MFPYEEIEQSETLTVEEAAKRLNYTPQRVRQLLREDKLQGHKVKGGRKWLIPKGEVDRYGHTTQAGAESEGHLKDKANSRNGLKDTQALQMEQSGHWPGLRRASGTLGEQLSAPLEQLLGLSDWDSHNPYLTLAIQNGDTTVALQVEEDPLFSALREHLPNNPAWDIVGKWKEQVINIQSQLPGLCQWVMDQPELRDLPHISAGESVWASSGLRDTFAKVVVLTAIEDVYHARPVDAFLRRSMEQEYELRPPSSDTGRQVLAWKLLSVSYAIAGNEDAGELERLMGLHMKLREDARDLHALQAVVNAFQELNRLKEALRRVLQRIENLALFPGFCELCSS